MSIIQASRGSRVRHSMNTGVILGQARNCVTIPVLHFLLTATDHSSALRRGHSLSGLFVPPVEAG